MKSISKTPTELQLCFADVIQWTTSKMVEEYTGITFERQLEIAQGENPNDMESEKIVWLWCKIKTTEEQDQKLKEIFYEKEMKEVFGYSGEHHIENYADRRGV